MFKITKLNSRGFSHHLIIALVVLVVGVGGTYLLVKSNANSKPSLSAGYFVATATNINTASYSWVNMSTINATFHGNPPGKNHVVTFKNNNAVVAYPYTNNGFYGNINCQSTSGSGGGQSVIGAPTGSGTAKYLNGRVLWKFLEPGNVNCTDIGNDGSNAPNKAIVIADPVIAGTHAHNIFYTHTPGTARIGYSDSSLGAPSYVQCNNEHNVFIQGGCKPGQCNNMLVVESNNQTFLWPLTSAQTSTIEPRNTETVHLDIVGCYFITQKDVANGKTASVSNYGWELQEASTAYVSSHDANAKTGQIRVYVPNLVHSGASNATSSIGSPTP